MVYSKLLYRPHKSIEAVSQHWHCWRFRLSNSWLLEDYLVHCRMFSSVPGSCSPYMHLPLVTTKHVSRCCQISPGGQIHPGREPLRLFSFFSLIILYSTGYIIQCMCVYVFLMLIHKTWLKIILPNSKFYWFTQTFKVITA